jgi:hypothetical protein
LNASQKFGNGRSRRLLSVLLRRRGIQTVKGVDVAKVDGFRNNFRHDDDAGDDDDDDRENKK